MAHIRGSNELCSSPLRANKITIFMSIGQELATAKILKNSLPFSVSVTFSADFSEKDEAITSLLEVSCFALHTPIDLMTPIFSDTSWLVHELLLGIASYTFHIMCSDHFRQRWPLCYSFKILVLNVLESKWIISNLAYSSSKDQFRSATYLVSIGPTTIWGEHLSKCLIHFQVFQLRNILPHIT